ncbi:unnamed protein product, partial [Discosporangium mesarthrocarpum]
GGGREFHRVEIMAIMQHHTQQVHLGRGSDLRAISPRHIVQNIRAIGRQFRLGRQEDAHEFLRHLLDKMVEGCLKMRRVKSSAPNRLAETTAINRIFGGYLRSQLRCTLCGHCSDTFDPFLDLSMDLAGGVTTLRRALQRFTAKETLDTGNRWRCGGCASMVRAEKQLTIFKPPNVLVVHLKRFAYGRQASKIQRHVEFEEKLSLTVTGPEKSASYGLTG